MNVNERASSAAGDEAEFESLLYEYRPFIASCACKVTGKHVDAHDDEMSIALIAFSEAIRRYRPDAGQFLAYAANVIRSRLIDFLREGNRKVESISLDSFVNEQDGVKTSSDSVQYQHMVQQPQSRYDDPLTLEIDSLTAALGKYGFSFMDVAKRSPKSTKTKMACRKVSIYLLENSDLLAVLIRTRQLPVQQLEESSGVSRKTIARHRNYIVCLAEILSGEYVCLAEYVKFAKKGDRV